MKPLILLAVLFGHLLFAVDIVWQKDLQHAFEVAQRENRLLMVFVEGEHCRWCKKMRYRTLEDERVVRKLSRFVNVRVDEADKEAMKDLPAIQGVPTIFFLYPNKEVIETAMGYYRTDDFLSFFKGIEQKVWQVK
jgi:uncharacterized protein YyaL (SSP411 family)